MLAGKGEGMLEPRVTAQEREENRGRPAPHPHRPGDREGQPPWSVGGADARPRGARWGEGTASVPARGCVCPRARQPLWGSGAAVPACPRCVCARVLGALFV